MTAPPYLDGDTLRSMVSYEQAIGALEAVLGAGTDLAAAPPRTAVPTEHGELLLMAAESPTAVGFKLLGLAPGNPGRGLPRIQAVYTLFDAVTLTPRVMLDGTALTCLRTAGLSALAARVLAVPDASVLTVFGAGPQARSHVEALAAVRPIEAVRIVTRHPVHSAALAQSLVESGYPATVGTADSVRDSDVVVCATTAGAPVFDGRVLPGHACVLAVGSHDPGVRELDGTVFARAGRVVVEDRATALREAGDVVLAVREGSLEVESIRDLARVLAEAGAPHRAGGGISVFKSVGMGWEDLAVAEVAHARWAAAQSGVPA